MFGLLRSAPHVDPVLGELRRSRGAWRGTVALAGAGAVALVVAGPRRAPREDALALARDAPTLFENGRSAVAHAVLEHIAPYVEAIAAGELPDPALPRVATADDLWPHVSVLYVSVAPLDRRLVTEFGLAIPWDEEHTLGARFADGGFSELCGSVLHP